MNALFNRKEFIASRSGLRFLFFFDIGVNKPGRNEELEVKVERLDEGASRAFAEGTTAIISGTSISKIHY